MGHLRLGLGSVDCIQNHIDGLSSISIKTSGVARANCTVMIRK
ncbi:hypothetical protein ACP4OV_029048 [Aristida adscensionis]